MGRVPTAPLEVSPPEAVRRLRTPPLDALLRPRFLEPRRLGAVRAPRDRRTAGPSAAPAVRAPAKVL
jgi:hypothetical protein